MKSAVLLVTLLALSGGQLAAAGPPAQKPNALLIMADDLRDHGGAFTLVTRGPQRFGRTVVTARWRFTQWSDGATELYDHDADSGETRDVSADPKHAELGDIAAKHDQMSAQIPPC